MKMMGTVIIGKFWYPYPHNGSFAPQFRSLGAVSEMPESGHLPIAGAIRWLVNSLDTIERPEPELFFYRHGGRRT